MKKVALDRLGLVALTETIDRECFVKAVQGLRDAIDQRFWDETMRALLRDSAALLIEMNRDFEDVQGLVGREEEFAKHRIIPGPEQIEHDLPLVYVTPDEYEAMKQDREALTGWFVRRLAWVFHTFVQYQGHFAQLVTQVIERPTKVELDGPGDGSTMTVEGSSPDFMFEIVRSWQACRRLALEYLQEKSNLLSACDYDVPSVNVDLGYDALGALVTAQRSVWSADRDAAADVLMAFRWAVVETFGLREEAPRGLAGRSTLGLYGAIVEAGVRLSDDANVLGNVLANLERSVRCAEPVRVSELFPFYRVVYAALQRLREMDVPAEIRRGLLDILEGRGR